MRLTSFGTITLPELNGRDSGIGSQARTNIINMRNGGYDLDGSEVFLQPLNISRNAIITEETANPDIDTYIDNLFGEMVKGRMLLKAEMRDATIRHTFAKMAVQMRDISADKYNCEQPVSFQWTANYPYWLNETEDFDYFDHGGTFDDGDSFDSGQVETEILTTSDLTDVETVVNDSKFKIYRVFFYFEINTSITVDSLTVRNVTNGCQIKINKQLSNVGSPVKMFYIDCLSKFAFSSFDTNEYESLEITGGNGIDWFWLEPGSNSIEYEIEGVSGSGGTIVCRILWSTHYL